MEQWRPIPDFPGYEVSDQGRVRSYYRPTGPPDRSWQIAEMPQRILRPSVSETGYCHVNLRRNGKSHGFKLHHLVLLAFHGKPLPGFECAHNNGDGSDNRLTNLRYDTRWGNAQDKRWRNGEPPEIWVPQLRQERANGATLKELAKRYHYVPNSIWSICRGRLYAHCGGPIMPKRTQKITDEQVIEIRQRIAAGEVQARLAEEYGVSEAHISQIKSGKLRKNLTLD